MDKQDPRFAICAAVREETPEADTTAIIGLPQALVDLITAEGRTTAINLRPYGIPLTIGIFIAENLQEASDRMDVMFGGRVVDMGYVDQSSQRKADGRD